MNQTDHCIGVLMSEQTTDEIPLADKFAFEGPNEAGLCTATFYAFNTVVTLQAYTASIHNEETRRKNIAAKVGNEEFLRNSFDITTCDADGSRKDADARKAENLRGIFEAARDRCRFFENRFSRTLSRSDISRLNNADGAWVEICKETYELLQHSLHYCEESGGVFDITMGSVVRLWDFHRGVIPGEKDIAEALTHVDWRTIKLGTREELNPRNDICCRPRFSARIADPRASVDVGGTAKGYIADDLGKLLQDNGLSSYVINLGGNVLAHGSKPQDGPWRVGIQDPRASRESGSILGAVPLENASAVTSGTYERYFMHNERAYHHILDPKTGYPVQTDLAGATVVARTSLDAEGYSTTLLALGKDAAVEFVRTHEAILAAYLVDDEGRMFAVTRG